MEVLHNVITVSHLPVRPDKATMNAASIAVWPSSTWGHPVGIASKATVHKGWHAYLTLGNHIML
jgi:hypothetical protein